jgi:HAD superfamily hydrolase (TIGR01549 family)
VSDRPPAVEVVLFDVDFTICRPGPELRPEAYARRGRELGLELDPSLFEPSRRAALRELKRHPELEHDDEIWIAFSERIISGMGGRGECVRALAETMTRAWERAEHFELYDDALPTLAELRRMGLRLGLISNTGRDLDAFVAHHGIDVDVVLGSRQHGKAKPDASIFARTLDLLGARPERAVMVGDSLEDDVEGALALGMRAFLVDREGVYPDYPDRLGDLRELPVRLAQADARA